MGVGGARALTELDFVGVRNPACIGMVVAAGPTLVPGAGLEGILHAFVPFPLECMLIAEPGRSGAVEGAELEGKYEPDESDFQVNGETVEDIYSGICFEGSNTTPLDPVEPSKCVVVA